MMSEEAPEEAKGVTYCKSGLSEHQQGFPDAGMHVASDRDAHEYTSFDCMQAHQTRSRQ